MITKADAQILAGMDLWQGIHERKYGRNDTEEEAKADAHTILKCKEGWKYCPLCGEELKEK